MLKIPEQAIQCFEELTDTRVACYAHSPLFTLALKFRIHNAPPCNEMKRISENLCILYDCLGLCRDAWKYPDGCVKICHAGLLEWVAPVMVDSKLLCLLVAGIRCAPHEIPEEVEVVRAEGPYYKVKLDGVPDVSRSELLRNMEALRQLAARLRLWYEKMHRSDFSESDFSRSDMIRFIVGREASKGMKLNDLARRLHLSPSRTAHVVREETGLSFTELVRRNRLEFAVDLLKNTVRPVSEIAYACGFGNVANFHRMFRKYYGETPLGCRNSSNFFPQKNEYCFGAAE